MKHIYDPIEYVQNYELLTFFTIGSFITWKFLNVLYERVYEPIINSVIPDSTCEKHYVLLKENKIKIGYVYRELVKWITLIFLLMILHNIITSNIHGGLE